MYRNNKQKPFKPYDPILDSGSPIFVGLIKKSFSKMPLFSIICMVLIVMSIVGFIGRFTFLKKYKDIDLIKEPFFAITLFGIKDKITKQDSVIPTNIVKRPKVVKVLKNKKNAKHVQVSVTSSNPVMPAKDYGIADRTLMADDSYIFNTDTKGEFVQNNILKNLTKAKDDSYFKDALFIGDSRMVGIKLYSNLNGKTNFFCRESTNIFNLPTRQIEYVGVDGERTTTVLDTLLSTHTYGKIYISLGINEMGSPIINYYNAYRKIIEDIRAKQPNALIFIVASLHVGIGKSSTSPVFNNTNLVQRNKAISQLANGRSIFYLDPNPAVCDKDGNLFAAYSEDELHLKGNCCNFWADFIRNNVIY